MIKLAIDIDDTTYNTRGCKEGVREIARDKFPTDVIARIKYEDELREDVNTWFNPDYLMPDAIRVLNSLQGEAELYICTARFVRDTSLYTKLFEGTGLTFQGIMQDDGFSTKAQACLWNDIDVLVDDDISNAINHLAMVKSNPSYRTHFIQYDEHAANDFDYAKRITTMGRWDDLPIILSDLNLLRRS